MKFKVGDIIFCNQKDYKHVINIFKIEGENTSTYNGYIIYDSGNKEHYRFTKKSVNKRCHYYTKLVSILYKRKFYEKES